MHSLEGLPVHVKGKHQLPSIRLGSSTATPPPFSSPSLQHLQGGVFYSFLPAEPILLVVNIKHLYRQNDTDIDEPTFAWPEAPITA